MGEQNSTEHYSRQRNMFQRYYRIQKSEIKVNSGILTTHEKQHMHLEQKCPMTWLTFDYLGSRDSFKKKGILRGAPFIIEGKTILIVWLLQPSCKSSAVDNDMSRVLVCFWP